MNAVSVPSPSHFVKHLRTLWHTCTLSLHFAHCETLGNTLAHLTMCTSLHTTSKLHTFLWENCWHTCKAPPNVAHYTDRITGSENIVSLYQTQIVSSILPKLSGIVSNMSLSTITSPLHSIVLHCVDEMITFTNRCL